MEVTEKKCKKCGRVRPIEKFKKVKGKYRSGSCYTCLNGSKQTNEERRTGTSKSALRRKLERESEAERERLRELRRRREWRALRRNPVENQINRANLFLRLFHSGISIDAAMVMIEEVYPVTGRVPMVYKKKD